MRKIYDCFIFFNELDLLELRLNVLDSYVDYFVICEASVTHSGINKEYIFENNKHRFSKFLMIFIHL
jgi:beta-1,4-mannosyl-glycoprotein beta-1,4-N-acetylglucosaminyltransferase